VCRTREELRLALPHDRTRAVVMTMGALHAGHAALIDAARRDVGPQGHVLLTIFVNPLQFGPGEDFDRYPRSEQADMALAREHGCDAIYLPSVTDVYGAAGPDAAGITVDPGPLGARWEGALRPGHFRGVLTVVLTLLHLTLAERAYYGEKDYQQLALIRSMARRFALPVRIIGVPTVRDHDGLALSSRNAYLDPAQRLQAAEIPRALFAARDAAAAGGDPGVVRGTAADILRHAGLIPDYLDLAGPDLGPAPEVGRARLIAAVPVGRTRLLDNLEVSLRGAA